VPSAPAKEYEPGVGIVGIDLEVRRGEVFGFIGPNGAGTTRMIRVQLALIRPTAGRVAVLGFDAQRESLQVRRRTGYPPGELKLPGAVTSRELLGHLRRLRDVHVTRSVDELAERLGLDASRRLGELSRGNR
jgi:ABC-2 type transport system ATP-binding protein